MSDKNEMHRDIMNLCCNELHAASPNELEQAAYGRGFKDARHQAAELVLAAKESDRKELEAAIQQRDFFKDAKRQSETDASDALNSLGVVRRELEAAKQRVADVESDRARIAENLIQSLKRERESQAEKEALEKKLAQQQAVMYALPRKIADSCFGTSPSMFRTTTYETAHLCVVRCDKDHQDEEGYSIFSGGTEELTKREAATRQQGFEEGSRECYDNAIIAIQEAEERGKQAGRNESLDEVLKGLRSENDSAQLRAIIASVEALYRHK